MQGRIEREATQYTQESQEKYGSLMDVQVYRGIPAETQKWYPDRITTFVMTSIYHSVPNYTGQQSVALSLHLSFFLTQRQRKINFKKREPYF